jgi:serine protease
MKKINLLLAALLVLSMTSMMPDEKDDIQQTKSLTMEKSQPKFHKGMITIKVKEGVGEFEKQRGEVSFNIPSLDVKVNKYEIDLLEKRFRYNPQKLRDGLPDLSRIYRIEFPEKYPVSKVAREFSKDPNIEYAEPIPVNYPDDIPDDELYDQCQHLPQIKADLAWNIHKGENGTEEIVIAINDSGVDWDHEDLVDNIWQNMGEDIDGDGHTIEYIGGVWVFDPDDINNFDDDGNGMVDDFIGWNFYTSGNDPNAESGNWHGTHCAGIAAGRTNNGVGIASISWNLKILPVQTYNPDGGISYRYDGIIYGAENGADIISNSWGALEYSLANHEVVSYAQQLGSIIVASAGNEYGIVEHYPSDYPGVVSVSSLSVDDTKASYSSFGPATDISAPGGGWEGGILSTMIGDDYGLASGTSMACPLMAGCFGLLKSYHPDWTNDQLIIQMIGTADDINSLNPDYQHLLGSGRVNTFRMLTEENVTMPQEFKLALVGNDPQDANGNKINESGEEVTLNFEFRNFIPYLGEENVTVNLETDDPEIIILDGTATVNIPPDGYFTIEDQFQIQVSEDANSHFAEFTIHFETNTPVVYGQDINFELLVAPSGIFIFEGEENGQDYSGAYYRAFLQDMGFYYTYSNTYPASLMGFETVFLSHGNAGQNLDQGYMFTEEHSLVCQEFLEDGGNVYIEFCALFSGMLYFAYPNYNEMKELFGVHDHPIVFSENPIDTLIGVENSPFEGIVFAGSNQMYNWYIDDLEPAAGAIIPFYENDYGNVSIMNDGSATFGHKAFYFGYSLAELNDHSSVSSRYNVLLKIMEFFGYELPEGYILSNFFSDINGGGSPLKVKFSDISVSDTGYQVNSWQWDFDNDGIIDSYEQNPTWTYNDGGLFDVMLIVSNGLNTDTLVLEDYITVNHGFLVFEGVPDGACYSGAFIRDYLTENSYAVTYRNTFPESLEGFGAVFLSFGNFGINYTELNDQMAATIIDYLENGGYVYMEGGDALGYDQVGNITFLNLFGLASAVDGTTNYIDSLAGQPDAITHEILFTSSSQLTNKYIDIFTPLGNATAAFIESNYGIVAVQYTGDFDQRSFCFSYALTDLDDGVPPNVRDTLLQRILDFFDIEPVPNNQTINISSGYQFVSTRIIPETPDMQFICNDILDNLDFVRNTSGQMLRKIGPLWINEIGDWITTEGYLFKMNNADELSILGDVLDPQTPISLIEGYQFISFLPENPVNALDAFTDVLNNLDFVRNAAGFMLRKIGQMWINGIGDLNPGEGYLVKMINPDILIYPVDGEKFTGIENIKPEYFPFIGGNAANPIYTIYIAGLDIGDEVAAFDGNVMTGAMYINSKNTFENELAVFSTLINGQGYEEGNPITFKVWSENNIVATDFTMEAIFDSYVSDVYPDEDGKYSIINITKGSIENMEETIFVYPNPVTGILNINSNYKISNVKVLNYIGQIIDNINITGMKVIINTSSYNSGIYFIQIKTEKGISTQKIIIE